MEECTVIAATTAQIVLKSQTVLLSVHSIFKFCANCLYILIIIRCGHEHFDACQLARYLWPRLIIISLYKQLA